MENSAEDKSIIQEFLEWKGRNGETVSTENIEEMFFKKGVFWEQKMDDEFWDYVDCEGGDIESKPLFTRKENEILPQGDEAFKEFLNNVNERIERRSRFMVAMLRIAFIELEYIYRGEYQEEWRDWSVSGIYKLFMDKVFLKDEVYVSGYSEVIEKIKELANIEIKNEISKEKWKELFNILKNLIGMGDRMKLYDFLEVFGPDTLITISDENKRIIEENIVGEITQRTMNRREVLNAYLENDKLMVITCLDSVQ